MTEKEKILTRIREALTLPAPRPGQEHTTEHAVAAANGSGSVSHWLPAVGPTFEDRLALFRKNAVDLKAEFHLAESLEDACTILVGIRDAEPWKKVGTHGGA